MIKDLKCAAIITSRNDNYGGNLLVRATHGLNSMMSTFDSVTYVDWASDKEPLHEAIRPYLNHLGKLKCRKSSTYPVGLALMLFKRSRSIEGA